MIHHRPHDPPMLSHEDRESLMGIAVLLIVVAVMITFALGAAAFGRDLGQWEGGDPAIRDWFQHLERPDVPGVFCCGEADAYWADEIHIRDGRTYATITDDRSDAPLGRPHVDVGTVVEIPAEKLKWDKSNPTGHHIVFLAAGRVVWCFVQTTGS